MNAIFEKKMDANFIDYVQRLYYEYNTRKDIINSIFEMHKYDADAKVLDSEPFKHYERLFMQSKIAYDQAMEEIQKTIIPEDFHSEKYRFEVSFETESIKVFSNEH